MPAGDDSAYAAALSYVLIAHTGTPATVPPFLSLASLRRAVAAEAARAPPLEAAWRADNTAQFGTHDNFEDWLTSIQNGLPLSPASIPSLGRVLGINIRVVGDNSFDALLPDGWPDRLTLILQPRITAHELAHSSQPVTAVHYYPVVLGRDASAVTCVARLLRDGARLSRDGSAHPAMPEIIEHDILDVLEAARRGVWGMGVDQGLGDQPPTDPAPEAGLAASANRTRDKGQPQRRHRPWWGRWKGPPLPRVSES